jgi:hypothetical protein
LGPFYYLEQSKMNQPDKGSRAKTASASSRTRNEKSRGRNGAGSRDQKNGQTRDIQTIRRLLRASFGQAWSAVFETLKTRFPKAITGSFADEAQALTWGLAVKTSLKNGQVRVHTAGKVISLEDSAAECYVHPDSGLLLENAFLAAARRREHEREQARRAELAARMRELSPELQVHLIAGKWFAVELQTLETADRAAHFDVVLNRTVQLADREALHTLYGRRHVVGKRKRELQYRELRDLQLTNG